MLLDEDAEVLLLPIAAVRPQNDEAAHATLNSTRARSGGLALVVTEGEVPGRYAQIGDAPIVVGRGVGVDLQISDPTVSRHHCVIWRASGRCWIRDLGSTNHTCVNNRSARIAELFEGDVIRIGQTVLTLAANALGRIALNVARTR